MTRLEQIIECRDAIIGRAGRYGEDVYSLLALEALESKRTERLAWSLLWQRVDWRTADVRKREQRHSRQNAQNAERAKEKGSTWGVEELEEKLDLAEIMAKFSPCERETLQMRIDGSSSKEIAEEQSTTAAAVNSRLQRIRVALRPYYLTQKA